MLREVALTIACDHTGKIPEYKSVGAAGLDLYSAEKEEVVLLPRCRRKITTGFSLAIPEGYCGKIEAKSGLALNHGLIVLGGLIDSDYRGVIEVMFYNTDDAYFVKPGQAIAQLVIYPCPRITLMPVTILPPTARGTGGFGSTGL